MTKVWNFVLWAVLTALITANTYMFILNISKITDSFLPTLIFGIVFLITWFYLVITLAIHLQLIFVGNAVIKDYKQGRIV